MVNEDVSLVSGGKHNLQYSSLFQTFWWIEREAVSIVVIGRGLEDALAVTENVARGYLGTRH